MPKLTLRKDPETRLISAEIVPENSLLSEFLESEIQQDQALIALLRTHTDNPDQRPFEITGNAHTLALTETDYHITSLNDDTMTSGPLGDFIDLLHQWDQFLNRN